MDEFIWHADATFDSDVTSQDSSSGLQCPACGRNFAQSNAYSTHVRSCQPQKKRIASSLDLAKERYRRKKARLNEPPASQPSLLERNLEAIGPSTEVRASKVSIFYFFSKPITQPRVKLPLFRRSGNCLRQLMTLAPLRRDGRVERAVDPHCISKTNHQRRYAVCLLHSQRNQLLKCFNSRFGS